MFAQDTPFIYHLRSRATPSSSGWYMNGRSWANIVYLLLICSTFILKLYISLIRPHLEYGSPVWSPYKAGDIKLIEGVQNLL